MPTKPSGELLTKKYKLTCDIERCKTPCTQEAPLITEDPNTGIVTAIWLAFSRAECDISRSICYTCIQGAREAGVVE